MVAVGGVSPTTGVTISKSLNVCTICGMTLDGAQMASAVHLLGSEQCVMLHLLLEVQLQCQLERTGQ